MGPGIGGEELSHEEAEGASGVDVFPPSERPVEEAEVEEGEEHSGEYAEEPDGREHHGPGSRLTPGQFVESIGFLLF